MTKSEIENLIIWLKANSNLFALYWNRVAFNSFELDQDELWLLVQPMNTFPYKCLKDELVQFQIIDKKSKSTSLQMQNYLDITKQNIIWALKTFNWFETVLIWDTWDQKLLKNNKERFVYTFRLTFIY